MMKHPVYIGTSGWSYPHWRGLFYPSALPQRKWFSHYAGVFSTVEINNTFYHQPSASTLQHWREEAPPRFLFAVKAHRYLTHRLRLKNAGEALHRFLENVAHLGKKLGPILYQLPPRWKKNLPRLRAFCELLPPHYLHVMEFRDRDWLAEDTYELLRTFNVGLCVHDMLPRHPRRITGAVVYVRFHGAGITYGGSYRRDRLKHWAEWIRTAAAERPVFAYFNNDACAYAVKNAQTLQELLAEECN